MRNDADHDREARAWLFDVLGQATASVIDDVRMNGPVSMLVRDEMRVMVAGRVMKRKARVVVA